MFRVHKSDQRGRGDHGWLKSFHTFSFAGYQDPAQMGFHQLRVMNEDWVQPGQGFGTHPHRDMEIVTYVLEGALEHKDSMGNGEVLRPGEFQRMTAGTGITHSEFNPSETEPVHLYQIWLFPREKGLVPSYEQKEFPDSEKQGKFRVVASPDGADGSLTIQQDAKVLLSLIDPNQSVAYEFATGRAGWLQLLRGSMTLGGQTLSSGDGVAIENETQLSLTGVAAGEVMLFDLP